jgi:hypothetical protein
MYPTSHYSSSYLSFHTKLPEPTRPPVQKWLPDARTSAPYKEVPKYRDRGTRPRCAETAEIHARRLQFASRSHPEKPPACGSRPSGRRLHHLSRIIAKRPLAINSLPPQVPDRDAAAAVSKTALHFLRYRIVGEQRDIEEVEFEVLGEGRDGRWPRPISLYLRDGFVKQCRCYRYSIEGGLGGGLLGVCVPPALHGGERDVTSGSEPQIYSGNACIERKVTERCPKGIYGPRSQQVGILTAEKRKFMMLFFYLVSIQQDEGVLSCRPDRALRLRPALYLS